MNPTDPRPLTREELEEGRKCAAKWKDPWAGGLSVHRLLATIDARDVLIKELAGLVVALRARAQNMVEAGYGPFASAVFKKVKEATGEDMSGAALQKANEVTGG